MKLIVMVPCLNEEATLPSVIRSIPKTIAGISRIETLIIDDGSTDNTNGVARRLGVDHIIRLKQNVGLAKAFQAGLDACLDQGADIVVNTDGDNQYPSDSIPDLIRPIINGKADITIGDRQTHQVDEFSPMKRCLQRCGSLVVRTVSGADGINDVVSGFRGFSRFAASKVQINTTFSYTIESIILASRHDLRIISVPIETNPTERPSRLAKSMMTFVWRSAIAIVRSYIVSQPVRIFLTIGSISTLIGTGLGIQLLVLMIFGEVSAPIQSLIILSSMIVVGLVVIMLGVLADLMAINRRLLEDLVWCEKSRRQGLFAKTFGSRLDSGETRSVNCSLHQRTKDVA